VLCDYHEFTHPWRVVIEEKDLVDHPPGEECSPDNPHVVQWLKRVSGGFRTTPQRDLEKVVTATGRVDKLKVPPHSHLLS